MIKTVKISGGTGKPHGIDEFLEVVSTKSSGGDGKDGEPESELVQVESDEENSELSDESEGNSELSDDGEQIDESEQSSDDSEEEAGVGGPSRGGAKKRKPKSRKSSRSGSSISSVSSVDTVELLSQDSLFIVLSQFLMSKSGQKNIVDVLSELNETLKSIALKSSDKS